MSDAIRTVSWRRSAALDICICALGARTPLGLNAAASAAAVRAAISAVGIHPFWKDKAGKSFCVSRDALLDAQIDDCVERIKQLALSAAHEALSSVAISAPTLTIFLALPLPRIGLSETYAQRMADAIGALRGDGIDRLDRVHVYPYGHAAGIMALQAAAQKMAAGEIEMALVVAADSYIHAETLEELDAAGRVMSAANRNGFPPGEGAAACVLATRACAERCGLPVLALLVAAATAVEPHPLGSDAVCIGEGLSAVIKTIGECLPAQQSISATYCDLNGERYRNEEFAYTLLRTQSAFRDAHDYLSPADCWGDVGAASGLLGVVLALQAQLRGYAKGPLPLCWAGSDSGHRAAVLLNVFDSIDLIDANYLNSLNDLNTAHRFDPKIDLPAGR